MSKNKKNWLIISVIYAAFFSWYTNLGGELSAEEIEFFLAQVEKNAEVNNRPFSKDRYNHLKTFMEEDTGKQFIMVNNIDINENPGFVEGAKEGDTADDLLNRYMEYMTPALLKRASHPIFMGYVVNSSMDVFGIDNAETWDRAALMRYKSRRAMMEIATNPVFFGKHDFKIKALEKTIAYPVEPLLYLSDLRLLLFLIFLSLGLILQIRTRN
jgi:hypothetical protein